MKIKSCRGTSVRAAKYTEEGLEVCLTSWIGRLIHSPFSQHDRKLAIIDAHTHKVITARDQPRVSRVYDIVHDSRQDIHPLFLRDAKMVLILPRIDLDGEDQSQGRIHVSFPADSGCEPFTIPLDPPDEVLQTWKK